MAQASPYFVSVWLEATQESVPIVWPNASSSEGQSLVMLERIATHLAALRLFDPELAFADPRLRPIGSQTTLIVLNKSAPAVVHRTMQHLRDYAYLRISDLP